MLMVGLESGAAIMELTVENLKRQKVGPAYKVNKPEAVQVKIEIKYGNLIPYRTKL